MKKTKTLLLDKKELISTVEQLQNQLKEVGERPIIETDFNDLTAEEESKKDWDEIQESFKTLTKTISETGVPDAEYARFLFLYKKGLSEEYNVYKNKAFDASIEKGLVVQDSGERFELNMAHKRNQKAIEIIEKIERLIQTYERDYGSLDDDDLYEHAFSDADFWRDWLGINVSI